MLSETDTGIVGTGIKENVPSSLLGQMALSQPQMRLLIKESARLSIPSASFERITVLLS